MASAGAGEAIDIEDVITRLIHLPSALHARTDASAYSLLKESGYCAAHKQVTEGAIHERLSAYPECVDKWMAYSEDKRANAGWFFERGKEG